MDVLRYSIAHYSLIRLCLKGSLSVTLQGRGMVGRPGGSPRTGRAVPHNKKLQIRYENNHPGGFPQPDRARRFPDKEELQFQYELEYRPLSQRYIVKDVQGGTQDSYATLFSALNKLGKVQDLILTQHSALDPQANYRFRLQALLSTKQYSAPLRMLFFWRDQWDLKSEWYEWQLQRLSLIHI